MASKPRTKGRFAPAGIVTAALGLLLFVYSVERAGVSDILNGLEKVSGGFVLILLLSAVRQVARALAWTRCVEGPNRLGLRSAFAAGVMGDALGNLTPLGLLLSEPAKAVLVRDGVPLVAALSGLAAEDLFYSLSVALVIASGVVALLLSFPVTTAVRGAALAALAGVAVIVFAGSWMVSSHARLLSGALAWLSGHGLGRGFLQERLERVRTLEERIYGFYTRGRAPLLLLSALEATFHLAGVAEVYVTLWLIGDTVAPTLLTAFILESVNRFITVAFKFVPMRLGVDEAGTGLLTTVLKFGPAAGVTLAVVRKARVLCWTALGIVLLFARGLTVGTAMNEAQEAVDKKR